MLSWPQDCHLWVTTDCAVPCPFPGEALSFAVRYITSQVHGARPGASKVVVILVTGSSMDSVEAAAAAARSNRECPGFSPETTPVPTTQPARGHRVGGGYFPMSWLISNA